MTWLIFALLGCDDLAPGCADAVASALPAWRDAAGPAIRDMATLQCGPSNADEAACSQAISDLAAIGDILDAFEADEDVRAALRDGVTKARAWLGTHPDPGRLGTSLELVEGRCETELRTDGS